MSISGNADFDPRFRPQAGGFDGAHDVRREQGRDRSAEDSKAEIAQLVAEAKQSRVARQAIADSGVSERPNLYIVEDAEIEDGDRSPFDKMGDYLNQSDLSIEDKMALLESLLDMQRREKVALDASRQPVSTHAAYAQGSGSVIELPVDSKPGKYGPRRTGTA